MRRLRARLGGELPRLGQGTWRMGEDPRSRAREVEALRLGLDLGLTWIDTAEMYADGGAEQIVGQAIRGRRDEVFVVSKVLPSNASFDGTLRAAERSLRRLGTDRIDLYLLHWPGHHPLEQTLAAFQELVRQGKIRFYGVSNFDLAELQRAQALRGGEQILADQVLYNLDRRGIEADLLPWCVEHEIALMAYSPLEQGRLSSSDALDRIARRRGVSPAQVALAWTIRRPGVISLPKSSEPTHVRENAAALKLELDEEDLRQLDRAHRPPRRPGPLEML